MAKNKTTTKRETEKKKSLLYVQTSGPDTPERLYSPFILAQTAKAMGLDATVYFLGKGVLVVKKGEAEKIKVGSFPTLKQVMDDATKAGVKLMICGQSCALFGLDPKGAFIPAGQVVGAATLNDVVLEADGTMWF
ncbi:MAG: DsrE family protein [Promethearchaeati archaeon SRVP18_Atabeyarchaeia-1]